MTRPGDTPEGQAAAHHGPVKRMELLVALVGLVGILFCLIGTGLVVFQPGRPTLGSSGFGIILFLIGAVMTGIGTLFPGEPEDLWTAWKARQSGPR